MALLRCEEGRHVVMLSAGQHNPWARHGAAKYAKFAYSTRFGFSVPAGTRSLEQGAFDSTLALSEDGEHWRPVRDLPERVSAADGVPALRAGRPGTTWRSRPGWWRAPWHVRMHRITTGRALRTAEGAFAVDRDRPPARVDIGSGRARLDAPHGLCVIEDLTGGRTGDLVTALPGTNVLTPRTTIPTLKGDLPPGEHLLACAVLGLGPAGPDAADGWPEPPRGRSSSR